MHKPVVTTALAVVILSIASATLDSQGGGQSGPRPPALLQDFIAFTVTAPPPELELDPFYKKYADAHGIPS